MFLSSALVATTVVGFIAYFMESHFTTVSRNLSEPWLWWTLGILWLICAGAALEGAVIGGAAEFLDRENSKSRKGER